MEKNAEEAATSESSNPLVSSSVSKPGEADTYIESPSTPNPRPNPDNPSDELPPIRTQEDWERERRIYADTAHTALNNFLKASVMQRADLLRDVLAVAISVLFGAFTLYFLSGPTHDIIKSPIIFFSSMIVLIFGIVANLVARAEIIKHLQDVSFQIEKNYIDLYVASRAVASIPSRTNIDTVWRAERETPVFPALRKRGDLGHTIAIWTTIVALIGMTFSFIVFIRI